MHYKGWMCVACISFSRRRCIGQLVDTTAHLCLQGKLEVLGSYLFFYSLVDLVTGTQNRQTQSDAGTVSLQCSWHSLCSELHAARL